MEHNAKNFALELGALITLFVSVGSLITLLFGIITLQFPDDANGVWELTGAMDAIRWGMALLIVFFPAYIALTRVVNTGRRHSGTPYLGLTKWLIYIALVIGGLILLGDMVAIIYNFLNGELTTRFLLKALTMLLVVGAPFTYYLYDTKGYWLTHETRSKQYGALIGVFVLAALVCGYSYIETPSEVRALRLDGEQINDLTTIQSFIESEFATQGKLPESLDALSVRYTLPEAPEGRDAYTYTKTSTTTFELCATFMRASDESQANTPLWTSDVGIKNPYDWNHKVGRTCFPRFMNVTMGGMKPVS